MQKRHVHNSTTRGHLACHRPMTGWDGAHGSIEYTLESARARTQTNFVLFAWQANFGVLKKRFTKIWILSSFTHLIVPNIVRLKFSSADYRQIIEKNVTDDFKCNVKVTHSKETWFNVESMLNWLFSVLF